MTSQLYYILKVKGKAKIPDYIQVRDESFTLIGYFRPGRGARHSQATAESDLYSRIEAASEALPFGVISKLEIEDSTGTDLLE